jgi:hypothetical protein
MAPSPPDTTSTSGPGSNDLGVGGGGTSSSFSFLVQAWAAFNSSYKGAETYMKVGLFVALTCLLSLRCGQPAPSQPYLLFLLLAALIAAISLAPWISTQRRAHHMALRDVCDQVTRDKLRTTLATAAARDCSDAATRYEELMLRGAASARRDAILAHTVHAADLSDAATRVYDALDNAVKPVEDAIAKAGELVEAATDVEDTDMSVPFGDDDDGMDEQQHEGSDIEVDLGETRVQRLGRYLRESTEIAQAKSAEVVAQIRDAQESVREPHKAEEQAALARKTADANAEAALLSSVAVLGKTAVLRVAQKNIAKGASEVSRISDQAIRFATEGEIARASRLAISVTEAANDVENLLKTVEEAMVGVQTDLLQWLQSSRNGDC